jgi:hypothetical protein
MYELGKQKLERMNAPRTQDPQSKKGFYISKKLTNHEEQKVDRHLKGLGRKERARSCLERAKLCGKPTQCISLSRKGT